jgi:UDP-N-acetylmuramate-alanine ligase
MNAVDRAEVLIHQGGHVHLMGIGGIGMAGVAWLLRERGFMVSGCDLQENRQTAWLRAKGIEIAKGHDASHISNDIDWLIRSTAVPDTAPEVQAALDAGIPVSRRGDVLPALMRDRVCIAVSGTHGKTTTTAMIAQVLGCGFCVGGEIDGFEGAVARDGEVMVVEADESDGTVSGYTPDYSIITNIEYDHMEHHDSEDAFIGCFRALIENTRKKVFYCGEDRIASEVCASDEQCVPYFYPEQLYDLPVPGKHNQLNAAGVSAVCAEWKVDAEIRSGLGQIRPIGRRFETVYQQKGIRIVSDYAHHPTEIAALIQTAQELSPKRLLGVFQPHRYTRTLALGEDFPPSFEGLDHLWLLPVYAASETPLEGGTSKDLLKRFSDEWDGKLTCLESMKHTWSQIQSELRAGDLLLIIGAGDIEQMADWAARLV